MPDRLSARGNPVPSPTTNAEAICKALGPAKSLISDIGIDTRTLVKIWYPLVREALAFMGQWPGPSQGIVLPQ